VQNLSASERSLRAEVSTKERDGAERIETIQELTSALGAMVTRAARAQQEAVPRGEYDSLAAEHTRTQGELDAARAEGAGAAASEARLRAELGRLEAAHEDLQEDAARLYETLR
jgi:hypothetical protein